MIKELSRRKDKKIAYPQYWWWWITSWFGCGHSPIVSGTIGSLGALPFAYLIHVTWGGLVLGIASLVVFAVGVIASDAYLKHTNRTDDASEIVVDEVAGQWLLLAALFPTWQSYLVGFLVFRAFDIVKPWPVNVADRKIHGGLGIMFDDMLAAAYPIWIYTLLLVLVIPLELQAYFIPFFNFISGH